MLPHRLRNHAGGLDQIARTLAPPLRCPPESHDRLSKIAHFDNLRCLGRPGRQLNEYLILRPDSPFSRLQREMLATVVMGMIGAKPCLSAHCEAMRRLTGDDDLGPDFVERWPDYPIDPQTRALLRYARLLTGSPDRVTDQDIEALREAGWDERAAYEATAVIAFLNFVGRFEAAAGLPMDEIRAEADLPIARPDGRPGGLAAST